MKCSFMAALPVLVLGIAACGDVPGPASPTNPNERHAENAVVPTAVAASAAIIYSNFGPGMTFDAGSGWGIIGLVCGGCPQQAISQQFSMPADEYVFWRASVALEHIGGPDRVRLFLQADSSGRPGHVVDSMAIGSIGSAPGIYTVMSNLAPVLTDTLYWLTVASGGDGTLAAWMSNSIGDASSTTFAATHGSGPGGPWEIGYLRTRGAFQIEGRALPLRGMLVHEVTAGGTVSYDTGERFAATIHATQMADGSVKGEVHFQAGKMSFDEKVSCLQVVGNRAYLAGYFLDNIEFPATFSMILEDNGEGSNASAPDRMAGLALRVADAGQPVCSSPFSPFSVPRTWTHGNVQVR